MHTACSIQFHSSYSQPLWSLCGISLCHTHFCLWSIKSVIKGTKTNYSVFLRRDDHKNVNSHETGFERIFYIFRMSLTRPERIVQIHMWCNVHRSQLQCGNAQCSNQCSKNKQKTSCYFRNKFLILNLYRIQIAAMLVHIRTLRNTKRKNCILTVTMFLCNLNACLNLSLWRHRRTC